MFFILQRFYLWCLYFKNYVVFLSFNLDSIMVWEKCIDNNYVETVFCKNWLHQHKNIPKIDPYICVGTMTIYWKPDSIVFNSVFLLNTFTLKSPVMKWISFACRKYLKVSSSGIYRFVHFLYKIITPNISEDNCEENLTSDRLE